MPRQYTQRASVLGNIVAADDFNAEVTATMSEYNGLLDQNQIPLDTIRDTHFDVPYYNEEYNGIAAGWQGHFIRHTYQQSQSYHVSEHCGENSINPGADTTTRFSDTQLTLGWIKLESGRTTGTYAPGAAVSFKSKEGMLVGEAMGDFEWRMNYWIKDYNTPQEETLPMDISWIEVGVFVNDVLCGRTDQQYLGGRFTFVVPFSCPIGSQDVKVDVRFKVSANPFPQDPIDLSWENKDNQKFIQDLWVWDSQLWVRNQYR